jgi:hypothetical protein
MAGRITQTSPEALILPTSQEAQITQVAVEVVIVPPESLEVSGNIAPVGSLALPVRKWR